MTTAATIHIGTGRRKTSTARVRLQEGTGQITVNGLPYDEYFKHENFSRQIIRPLMAVDAKDKYDVTVSVAGGGNGGQAGATAHGIARALLKVDAEWRSPLKKGGHLTRDPREKERKKSGQPGARKRFQFSKR